MSSWALSLSTAPTRHHRHADEEATLRGTVYACSGRTASPWGPILHYPSASKHRPARTLPHFEDCTWEFLPELSMPRSNRFLSCIVLTDYDCKLLHTGVRTATHGWSPERHVSGTGDFSVRGMSFFLALEMDRNILALILRLRPMLESKAMVPYGDGPSAGAFATLAVLGAHCRRFGILFLKQYSNCGDQIALLAP